MRAVALASLILASPALSQADDVYLDAPPKEWLLAHAPYGFDITPDGKTWVNIGRSGRRDDYAILSTDLYKALTQRSSQPRIWIRGYHIRNKKLKYRQSKQLVTIDCMRDTLWVQRELAYAPDGDIVWDKGPFNSESIVPGSVGERWRNMVCSQQ